MSSGNENRADTRTEILRATVKLLADGRHAEVRMGDIARLAGISRQAVYLHFASRADLLTGATRYVDEIQEIDQRLQASRSAQTGIERLDAFVDAWGNYIPQIYGIGKALMAMQETDEAAATAWNDRMQAVREGCEAAVAALDADQMLRSEYSVKQGTDILWTLLSVRNWEQLSRQCGWSQSDYLSAMKSIARSTLVNT